MADRGNLRREEVEEEFRESLKDLLPIVEELQPYCENPKEIQPIIALAVENRTLLRILVKLMLPEK